MNTVHWTFKQSRINCLFCQLCKRVWDPDNRITLTTQTATPPFASSTRQEASDHQCVPYQHKTGHEHLFTLRKRCSPHHRGLIRLRISDRKFVNHTAEMILWSMILMIWFSVILSIVDISEEILTIWLLSTRRATKGIDT